MKPAELQTGRYTQAQRVYQAIDRLRCPDCRKMECGCVCDCGSFAEHHRFCCWCGRCFKAKE